MNCRRETELAAWERRALRLMAEREGREKARRGVAMLEVERLLQREQGVAEDERACASLSPDMASDSRVAVGQSLSPIEQRLVALFAE